MEHDHALHDSAATFGELIMQTAVPADARKDTEPSAQTLRPRWIPWQPQYALSAPAAEMGSVCAIGVSPSSMQPEWSDFGIRWDDTADAISEKLSATSALARIVLAFPDASPDRAPDEALVDRCYLVTVFLLRLVKALHALDYGSRELAWSIVTRHAQGEPAGSAIDPACSAIHGLAGSMAKEYPAWRVTLLDVDAALDGQSQAWRVLPADGEGNTLVLREEQWYRQVLETCRIDSESEGVAAYREGGVYFILGGAGGLGEVLSEHLITRYRARLVWVARRALDDTIERKIERLAALGPKPLYLSFDTSDGNAWDQALVRIREEFGAVHGVVHSAITLEDGSLANLSEQALRRVMAAKVEASMHLARVFRDEPLDFMLFFSSAASFLKSGGQGNYVAGCMFKDALAARLAALVDFPVKVIHWGYWGTTGIVANPVIAARMAEQGIASIDPATAMDVLERLLRGRDDRLVHLSTYRTLASLGVPIEPPGSLAFDLRRVLESVGKDAPDDSRPRIEAMLLPLLWAQIKQAGIVVQPPTPAGAGERHYVTTPSRHERWLRESLLLLAESGLLELRGETIVVGEQVDRQAPDWEGWSQAVEGWGARSDCRYWLGLLAKTLPALPDILAGREQATHVLFPDSSIALVETFYKNDRVATAFNRSLAALAACWVRHFQKESPSRSVRILEIGAGTGASSDLVFERFDAEGLDVAEYCYTDISKTFLLDAQQRYGTMRGYLTYEVLDIERFEEVDARHLGRYDLVLASNVLHATHDIRRALAHAKSLLGSDGVLLINEISKNTLMMHLTFGLLDGWWLHGDAALRLKGGPALASATWCSVLSELGLWPMAWSTRTGQDLDYQLIVAQRRPDAHDTAHSAGTSAMLHAAGGSTWEEPDVTAHFHRLGRLVWEIFQAGEDSGSTAPGEREQTLA